MSAPTGTVTFLFTDIEGSTKRWEQFPGAMALAVERHDALLREIIKKHGGLVFKTIGDAFCAAFSSASEGVETALEAQRAIAAQEWGEVAPLRVRMALHTGVTQERDNDYFGSTVNRVARILGVGHGGQTLLSQLTWQMLQGAEPVDATFRDLGTHRLKDLAQAEQIYGLCAPGLDTEFPPLKSLNRQAHNLPVHPTPLIGRDEEVSQVLGLLRDEAVRLVTLSGTGGTGKTRLSLQIAAHALDGFPDGAYFVSLAHAVDSDEVVAGIGQALGLRETAETSPLAGLTEHLRPRQCLLVLDNFEQVTASAGMLADLLASCPDLKMLVTSQSVLRLRGEREFVVSPLGLPPKKLPPLSEVGRFPAIELFVTRAQAVRPDFDLTRENVAAVVEICRRLDGLPLALELAAARSKLLTPQTMLGHLKHRLKLLTGGARDLPQRQRTLRDAIAWSHDLLEEEEKVLLRRLAVFQGGFTLEAALAVAELPDGPETDVFNGVEALVDKSLLRRQEVNDEHRFSMLENIREFSLENLGESGEKEAVQALHSEFFGGWMEGLAKEAKKNPSLDMGACEIEHENLRAALEWRFAAAGREAAKLALALTAYWERQGHFREAREALARCLTSQDAMEPMVEARLLEHSGWFQYLLGDYAAARAFMEERLERCLANEKADIVDAADAWNDVGVIALGQGDNEKARTSFEASLALVRQTNDQPRTAIRLMNLAMPAIEEGRFEEAHALLIEASDIFEGVDDLTAAACFCNLADLDLKREEYASAAQFSQRSLTLFRQIGDPRGVSFSLTNLAEAVMGQGDYAGAIPYLEEALTIAGEVELQSTIPLLLESLSTCYSATGEMRRAFLALGAASVFRTKLSLPRTESEEAQWSEFEGKLAEQLGEAAQKIRVSLTKISNEVIIVHVVDPKFEGF